jgi:hypothetical protein
MILLTIKYPDRCTATAFINIPLSQIKDRINPTEKPFGFFCAHVDATMAHWHTKVLMPVGAVEGMPDLGEEARPRDPREHISIGIGQQIPFG